MRQIIVTDSTNETTLFAGDDLRFWHEGAICRVYRTGAGSSDTNTLASFTNPISVIVKEES